MSINTLKITINKAKLTKIPRNIVNHIKHVAKLYKDESVKLSELHLKMIVVYTFLIMCLTHLISLDFLRASMYLIITVVASIVYLRKGKIEKTVDQVVEVDQEEQSTEK